MDGGDVVYIIIKLIWINHVVNNGHIDLILINLKLKKIKKKPSKKLFHSAINPLLYKKIYKKYSKNTLIIIIKNPKIIKITKIIIIISKIIKIHKHK